MDFLSYFALLILIFVVLVLAYGMIAIHDIPYHMAVKRDHSFPLFTSTDTNRIAVIDAGTGLRNLGRDLRAIGHEQEQIVIAFTHFHWDHMQMQAEYFPVQLDHMGANFEFPANR